MENNEPFHYVYSGKNQEEIKAIRKKYLAPEEQEDRMAQLRRLDASVSKKAAVRALAVGIVGALIMGLGMSLTMTELPEILGIPQNLALSIGIAIGLAGIVLVCLAYPMYSRTLRTERRKIAPEILRLTDELMK